MRFFSETDVLNGINDNKDKHIIYKSGRNMVWSCKKLSNHYFNLLC